MESYLHHRKAIVLFISVWLFTGCIGDMHGIVRGQSENVNVTERGGMYSIALPDGEAFKGKRVQVQTNNLGDGALMETPGIRSPFGDVTYYYDFLYRQRALTYGGILSGDRGHTMWCNIFATVFGGGKGLCDISDGRTIDLQW